MTSALSGQVALITGASGGVGRAVAIALSRMGVRCVLLSRDRDRLEETAARLSTPPAAIHALDLQNRDALDAAMTALCAAQPPPTLFIHGAAPMFTYQKLHQTALDVFSEQLAVNVESAAQICGHLLPEMMLQRRGRIVFLGSLGARVGFRGAAAYNLAKAAQESLVRSIALEYGRYRINANVLVLGPLDGARLASREQAHPGAREALLARSPARRLPTPSQVAEIVVFFCSPSAAPINGATLDVSYGAHLNAG